MAKFYASTYHGVTSEGLVLENPLNSSMPQKIGSMSFIPSRSGESITTTLRFTDSAEPMSWLKLAMPKILAAVLPGAKISGDRYSTANDYDRAEYVVTGMSMTDIAEAMQKAKAFTGPTSETDVKTLCEAAKSAQAHVARRTRATGFHLFQTAEQWEAAVSQKRSPATPASQQQPSALRR